MEESTQPRIFVKKRGKYHVYELEKQGQPFKLLVEGIDNGKIKQIVEKPNLKQIKPSLMVSGAHLVMDHPERNHVDFYQDGKKISIEKTPYKTFQYWISGDKFGI